ncbi:MAG: hypothetical protein JSV24_02920 [Bacteroidales bacterium]|nr:MAG: hypothetical protein JSV24_02920 [Bacteroidales bacterium]
MEKIFITGSGSIVGTNICTDGKCGFNPQDFPDFTGFIKAAYKHFKIGFPKFYKMDNLSKLAFLTSEILLRDRKLTERYKPEETGIVLLNSSSTLETDDKHYHSIRDRSNYFPSPAVFVYTLPNIMIGEISIRNRIMGENVVFISEEYKPEILYEYVTFLMTNGHVNACIAGWVEYGRSGKDYESVMYLVEKVDFTNLNIKFETSYLEKHYCDLKAKHYG